MAYRREDEFRDLLNIGLVLLLGILALIMIFG